MNDRAEGRSTTHLAVDLTVRDALLAGLAFSSGVFEAICFLSFGKVFTAFQTGNLVFLGVIASGIRPPLGPQPVTVVFSLAAFAAGAALSMPILRSFDGDVATEHADIAHVWPSRVSATLGAALVVQVGFLAVWITTRPSVPVSCVLVGLSACAMGLQMNAVRSLHVPSISTTAATATFVSLVSGATTRSLTASAAWRMTGVLVMVAVGAALGGWLLGHAHTYAPVPPALMNAIVIAVALLAKKPDADPYDVQPRSRGTGAS